MCRHNDVFRSVEVMRVYRSKMKVLSKEWISLDDYCKHAFLGYPVIAVQRDGCTKKRVDPLHMSSGTIVCFYDTGNCEH